MARTALQKSFAPAKRLLPRAIWSKMRALATAMIAPVRFSTTTGHWKSSLRTTALSASGSPIPWYTYPAIDFLAQRDFKNRNILEFGGGQSTLWWSARARSVLTVEENLEWVATLGSRIGSNVSLHYVPADLATRDIEPVRAVLATHPIAKFDVIVIDGHLREELISLAFGHLASGGAVLLDNAEGYGIYEALKEKNCRRIDFYGFAPGVILRHCTSLVFVDDCFLLQPDSPIVDLEAGS